MNLGENIYRLRAERNMSQGDLADALDVSRQSVSKWENNSAVPELDKLVKLSELFDISLDELITGAPPATAQIAKSPVSYSYILSLVMFALSGASLVITILFGNRFGIHTDEGVMLALLFALIGTIVRNPLDRKLFSLCRNIYIPLLIVVITLVFFPVLPERFLTYTAAYGVILLGWHTWLRRRESLKE